MSDQPGSDQPVSGQPGRGPVLPPPLYPPAAVPVPDEGDEPAEQIGLPDSWPVVPPVD